MLAPEGGGDQYDLSVVPAPGTVSQKKDIPVLGRFKDHLGQFTVPQFKIPDRRQGLSNVEEPLAESIGFAADQATQLLFRRC